MVFKLLKKAEIYKHDLKVYCVDFVIVSMVQDNAFRVISLANAHACPLLIKKAMKRLFEISQFL